MAAEPVRDRNEDSSDAGPSLAPDTQIHVAIVDDDSEIRRLLSRFLKGHGYVITAIPDARSLFDVLSRQPVDLIILDLMLPGTGGLEICKAIRANSTVPIIMLTAKREETDRIIGLELGADDYLVKPFNPRELLARMKAVLRRVSVPPGQIGSRSARGYSFDSWRLDTLRRELTNPQGVVVDLSGGEYDLLLAFVEAPQRVLSRDYLLEIARQRVATGFDRSIDTQLSRLRRKLDSSEDSESLIKTVRGAGYMFMPAVARS